MHKYFKNKSREKFNALVPFLVSSNGLYAKNSVIPLFTTQTQVTDSSLNINGLIDQTTPVGDLKVSVNILQDIVAHV